MGIQRWQNDAVGTSRAPASNAARLIQAVEAPFGMYSSLIVRSFFVENERTTRFIFLDVLRSKTTNGRECREGVDRTNW